MLYDIEVPTVAPPRPGGHAPVRAHHVSRRATTSMMGAHNNIPGHTFTTDGNAPRFPVRQIISRTRRI